MRQTILHEICDSPFNAMSHLCLIWDQAQTSFFPSRIYGTNGRQGSQELANYVQAAKSTGQSRLPMHSNIILSGNFSMYRAHPKYDDDDDDDMILEETQA